ncbi:uncharacterized protein [Procambarus clarkii]|uniref:uncharacterized protein isoform X1 n=1 Tax=Procambarus clarkii TaxID=6728 RepID=UPI001E670BBF|nr:uncharacterized protein LOC123765712 isoform X1 [Procambarus clarkii]
MAFTKISLSTDRMSRDSDNKENKLHETLQLLLKPVSVVLEKIEPSLITSYGKGPINKYKPADCTSHASLQFEKQHKEKKIGNTLPRPPVEFSVLMILLLKNTTSKSLKATEVKDIITALFPYYRIFHEKSWDTRFSQSTCGKFKSFFIKTRIVIPVQSIKEESPKKRGPGRPPKQVYIKEESPKKRGPGRPRYDDNAQLCIALNLAKKCIWETYMKNAIKGHEEQLKACTTQPNFLEALLSGAGRLEPCNKSNYKGIGQDGRIYNFGDVVGKTPALADRSSDCTSIRKLKGRKKTKNRVNTSHRLKQLSAVRSECESISDERQESDLAQNKDSVQQCPILLCDDSPIVHVNTPINNNKVNVTSSPGDGNQHKQTPSVEALPVVQLLSKATSSSDIQGEKTFITSDNGGNQGASVVSQNTITITAHMGTKRKRNDDNKVIKSSTSLLPAIKRFCSSKTAFESSLAKASNNEIRKHLIQKDILVGASLQGQSVVLSNNVQHAKCHSNSAFQLKSNYSHTPAKISDTEVVSMRNETARNECLPNLGITDQTFDNNLPVIKDVWSQNSVSGAVNGTHHCNLVNSQSGIMGLPIITEVTSLASSNQEENVYGNQTGNAQVSINQIEKCQNTENDSSAGMNVIYGNRQNPNELGGFNTSLTEDGREFQIIKDSQNINTIWRDQLRTSDKRQYGRHSQKNSPDISETVTTVALSNDISNKAATKITDGHASQNLSTVNQEMSSNSKSGISACSVSTSINKSISSFPQVSSCIEAWHKVFPWMLYRETDHGFFCKTCKWGANTSECHAQSMVYTMKDSSDVLFVAGYLRTHQETHFHKTTEHRISLVITLFKSIYPFIRHSLYKGLQDLVKYAVIHNGGSFPGPEDPPQRGYFTYFMIMRIAEYIEMDLLASLAKSPFFSITSAADKEFAILRWLNQKGEPEEHFFCSKICHPKEDMSIRVYLQKREVDMTKLISFSHFPNKKVTPSCAQISQLAIRYPPLNMLMKWLQKTCLLKDIFYHLEMFARLCRIHPDLARFPEVAEVVQIKKPVSYGCLVNEKIMKFFFGAINEIKSVCVKIHNETGNVDALNFSKWELKNSTSVQGCVSLLHTLHNLLAKKDCSYVNLYTMINEFRSSVCSKMKVRENLEADVYAVLSLFDLYLSHVIISLLTPEQKLADIFAKKLRHVTVNDVEKITGYLNSSFEGGSEQCLQTLLRLCIILSKSEDCSVFELLECFATKQELCKAFPELFSFYQKIKVLPFFQADTGQYMFNLAVLEMLSSNKVEKHYIPLLSLIILEGPPIEDIDIGKLLDIWAYKWKMLHF